MQRVRAFTLGDLGPYLDLQRKIKLRRRRRALEAIANTRRAIGKAVAQRAVAQAVCQFSRELPAVKEVPHAAISA